MNDAQRDILREVKEELEKQSRRVKAIAIHVPGDVEKTVIVNTVGLLIQAVDILDRSV